MYYNIYNDLLLTLYNPPYTLILQRFSNISYPLQADPTEVTRSILHIHI